LLLPAADDDRERAKPGTRHCASARRRPPAERGSPLASNQAWPVTPGIKRIRSAAQAPPSVTTLSASNRCNQCRPRDRVPVTGVDRAHRVADLIRVDDRRDAPGQGRLQRPAPTPSRSTGPQASSVATRVLALLVGELGEHDLGLLQTRHSFPRMFTQMRCVCRGTSGDFLARASGRVTCGKPAPDIYLDVLARIGVAPEHSVGLEDSANSIRSLRAAGMGVVAAPGPEFPLTGDVLSLADVCIDDMSEVTVALVEQAAAARRARWR
jgi:hypothetical protein